MGASHRAFRCMCKPFICSCKSSPCVVACYCCSWRELLISTTCRYRSWFVAMLRISLEGQGPLTRSLFPCGAYFFEKYRPGTRNEKKHPEATRFTFT